MIFIGIFTALIASSIDIAIEEGSSLKFSFLKQQVDRCVTEGCLVYPFLYWVLFNIIPVLIGSALVVYVEVPDFLHTTKKELFLNVSLISLIVIFF